MKTPINFVGKVLKRIFRYLRTWPNGQDEDMETHVSKMDKGRYVITNIGGKDYRLESDDKYLADIEGTFEPNMVELFDSLIKPGDTVLDVGANIGCTSILFGNRAEKVICFEPSPTTFRFLKKNIQASGLMNVFPENLGLGKVYGSFELTFSADNRAGGFVSNKIQASSGHKVEIVEVVPGDAFVQKNAICKIDFIKIDVEGFERDVIDGLRKTILEFKPTVVLELNHWCLNVLQRTSVPDFVDFLRNVFPYLYAVDASDVRNLHDVDDTYHVMYHHVVGGFKYPSVVGSHDPKRLVNFFAKFGGKA